MKLLLAAVVAAQALDAITFAAMPRAYEANPLAAGMHSEAAWLAKALLVVLVVAIQPALRPRYPAVGEAVALVAICAGCLGAGANLSVLTAVGRLTPFG